MLNDNQLKAIEKTFFGGNPEKAYTMVSNMREWDQFLASVLDKVDEAYLIMQKSNLENYNKIPFVF